MASLNECTTREYAQNDKFRVAFCPLRKSANQVADSLISENRRSSAEKFSGLSRLGCPLSEFPMIPKFVGLLK